MSFNLSDRKGRKVLKSVTLWTSMRKVNEIVDLTNLNKHWKWVATSQAGINATELKITLPIPV